MKKKLFGCLLIIGLVLGQVLTAHANPSPGNKFDVSQDSKDDGFRIEETDDKLTDLPDELKDKKPISPGLHITYTGSENKDVYRVEIYVPNLSDEIPKLVGHYYIEEEDRWVTTESIEIDYENNTVTFEFEAKDILLYLFADGELFEDAVVGTSPKTGAGSEWMSWLAAAIALAGCAMALSRKKRA